MAVLLQRMRVSPGALDDVRGWLETAADDPAIAAAHHELGLWVEHLFLVEEDERTFLFSYLDLDDPESLAERATALSEPVFADLRERFRSWFDEVLVFEPKASVVAVKSPV